MIGLLIGLIPAFALVALLREGIFPGERLIERARRRVRDLLMPRAQSRGQRRARTVDEPRARLGALLSRGLAGRGPPRPLA